MNRKQFGILVVLLVILGGGGLLLQNNLKRQASAGGEGAGRKLLGDKFPVNDVAQVTIKHGTNEVNLVKKDDLWRVRERDDYPADFSAIGSFLIKAADLKVVQVEEIGPSQLGRLELAAQGTNAATTVDFKDKDGKAIKSLLLGKKHVKKSQGSQAMSFGDDGFSDGRYVMVSGDTKNALLIADPLSSLEPKPEQWLKKEIFHIERPKSVAVTFPVATNSWKVVRDGDSSNWKLSDAQGDAKLDNAKALSVANPFASPTINDVLSLSAKPEETGLDKPTVVTVETFDDFVYTVKVGKKMGENYPIAMTVESNAPKERIPAKDEKPEDKDKADKAWKDRQKQLDEKLKEAKTYTQRVYLVPTYSVEPYLKERKDLLEEKKEEKPATVESKAENKTAAE